MKKAALIFVATLLISPFVGMALSRGAYSRSSALLPVISWPQVTAPHHHTSSQKINEEETLILRYNQEREIFSLSMEKQDTAQDPLWELKILESSLPFTYSFSFNGLDLLYLDLRLPKAWEESCEEKSSVILMPDSGSEQKFIWNGRPDNFSETSTCFGRVLINTAGELLQMQSGPLLHKRQNNCLADDSNTAHRDHTAFLEALEEAGAQLMLIRENEALNKCFVLARVKETLVLQDGYTLSVPPLRESILNYCIALLVFDCTTEELESSVIGPFRNSSIGCLTFDVNDEGQIFLMANFKETVEYCHRGEKCVVRKAISRRLWRWFKNVDLA